MKIATESALHLDVTALHSETLIEQLKTSRVKYICVSFEHSCTDNGVIGETEIVKQFFHSQQFEILFRISKDNCLNLPVPDGYILHCSDLSSNFWLDFISKKDCKLVIECFGCKRIEIYRNLKYIRSIKPELDIILIPGNPLNSTKDITKKIEEIRWNAKAYKDFNIRIGYWDCLSSVSECSNYFLFGAIGAEISFVGKKINPPLTDAEQTEIDFSKIIPEFDAMLSNVKAFGSDTTYPSWSIEDQKQRDTFIKRNPVNSAHERTQHVGILVCARSASTRLPQKALMKICGKESIALLLERMRVCKKADRVVLCTTQREDDNVLAGIGEKEGVDVFRGSDENVALRMLDAAKHYQLDHIVRVTGDDLLRSVELIDKAVSSHLKTNSDYTFMDTVFYGGDSEIISYNALETIVDRAVCSENTEYLSWYLDDESAFIQNRYEVAETYWRDYRLTLDTEEDYEVIKAIYEKLYKQGKPVKTIDALMWLDRHPEISGVNQNVQPKLSRFDLNLELRI